MDKNKNEHQGIQAPGTLVLIAIFFLVFVALYFANWILLSEAWPIR